MNSEIIYRHILQTYLPATSIHSELRTQNFTISDMVIVLLVVASLYIFMRSRVTDMGIVASESRVWRSLGVFIIAIPLSIMLSGVTLGAVVSRHILRRHITIDWYSVILGSIAMVVISYVPIVNYLVMGVLSVVTLAAIMHTYIVKTSDTLFKN